MSRHDAESDKTLAEHKPASHDESKSTMHGHERFPTTEELDVFVRKEVENAIAIDLAIISYERHVERTTQHHAFQETNIHPSHFTLDRSGFRLRDSLSTADIKVILVSLRHSRIDHRILDKMERDRFNNALKLAHQAGTYQPLAAIHTDMTHHMHSMSGSVGTQRFLPWHRLYLLQCENLLRIYEPAVRIPYWDYATDHVRPDWVWQPPKVNRGAPGGGAGGALPTPGTITLIDQNISYTEFTYQLEFDAHNQVHNWCNGTITSPPTAAYDPIFWLLHANVDRLWNNWQMKHNGKPILKALDWVLDPFGLPATDVDSILALGYWYG